MLEILEIFYAACLILKSESDIVTARRFEDDKLEIAVKKTNSNDDTIVIWEKLPIGNRKVYEISCYPSVLTKGNQIYLRGYWKDYLTKALLRTAKSKLDKRPNKIESFDEWMKNAGITSEGVVIEEIDDEKYFFQNSNTAQG